MSAIYKGATHPDFKDNVNIQLTIVMGIKEAIEVDPDVPTDVAEHLVKYGNKFKPGVVYTIRELRRDFEKAALELSIWKTWHRRQVLLLRPFESV